MINQSLKHSISLRLYIYSERENPNSSWKLFLIALTLIKIYY